MSTTAYTDATTIANHNRYSVKDALEVPNFKELLDLRASLKTPNAMSANFSSLQKSHNLYINSDTREIDRSNLSIYKSKFKKRHSRPRISHDLRISRFKASHGSQKNFQKKVETEGQCLTDRATPRSKINNFPFNPIKGVEKTEIAQKPLKKQVRDVNVYSNYYIKTSNNKKRRRRGKKVYSFNSPQLEKERYRCKKNRTQTVLNFNNTAEYENEGSVTSARSIHSFQSKKLTTPQTKFKCDYKHKVEKSIDFSVKQKEIRFKNSLGNKIGARKRFKEFLKSNMEMRVRQMKRRLERKRQ